MTPKLTLTDAPPAQAKSAIADPLVRFNEQQAGRSEHYRPLAILISDHHSGEIIGGLWGDTMFSHLHVDLLFVPTQFRGAGLGRQIMGQAETEAIRRGCIGAWLDTYSFQARGFYERLGYTMFGIIEDFPPGQSRIFLRKAFCA